MILILSEKPARGPFPGRFLGGLFYVGKFHSGRNRKHPFNSIKKDVFGKCICQS